jgi:hypothetical protein
MEFAKITTDKDYKKSLFSSLKEKCCLNHIQYYSPYFKFISSELTEDSILSTVENVSKINNTVKFFNPKTDIKKQVNKLYNILEFNDINNIYELNVEINNNTTKDIICKVSPIINPIFLFDRDLDINELNINTIYESNNVPAAIKEEIESNNNFAYVESFILYILSNITINKLTPLFPSYYGSINGISKHYYFNITEYLDDIYGTKEFDNIKKLYKILYFENDYLSISSNSSLKSELDNSSSRNSPEIIEDSSSSRNSPEIIEDNIDNNNFCSMIEEKLQNKEDKIVNAEPIGDLFSELEFCNDNKSDKSYSPIKGLFPELDLDNIPEADLFKPDNKHMYVCLENYPVSYCFMEKLNYTLEDYLENEMYYLKNEEWYAIFFQLAYGLAVANKLVNFVHNDLHECNVMFQETEEEYIYYIINEVTYRIPTYGKIVKIIDFARSTIKFADKWILSNHYNEGKEAYGIYDIPDENGQYTDKDNIKPNTSFDLVRFFTTIAQYVEENNEEIYNFIYKWSYDDNKEHNMIDEENEFELYINISHNCHNCEPIEFLKDNVFNQFILKECEDIDNAIMKYNFTDCCNIQNV